MIAKIRNRVKDLSDKEKLDIRKTKDCMVYLLAFLVAILMQIFYPASVLGDGGDEPGSGYTMYWKEEGCPEEQAQVVVNVLWDDKDDSHRPEYILLQLYKNDKSYNEPKILNEENGWSYYWGGLSADAKWHIEEIEVPKGYAKEIVEAVENVYVIVHKYDPDGKLKKKDREDVKNSEVSAERMVTKEPPNTMKPNINHGPSDNKTVTLDDVAKEEEPINNIKNETITHEMVPVNMCNVFIAIIMCMVAYRGIQSFRKSKKKKVKSKGRDY